MNYKCCWHYHCHNHQRVTLILYHTGYDTFVTVWVEVYNVKSGRTVERKEKLIKIYKCQYVLSILKFHLSHQIWLCSLQCVETISMNFRSHFIKVIWFSFRREKCFCRWMCTVFQFHHLKCIISYPFLTYVITLYISCTCFHNNTSLQSNVTFFSFGNMCCKLHEKHKCLDRGIYEHVPN
jgi:hypothetical protein